MGRTRERTWRRTRDRAIRGTLGKRTREVTKGERDRARTRDKGSAKGTGSC